MNDGRSFSGVLAFLAGGLVGAGLAMLYSPVSGREAGERVGELARDVKNKTKKWAGDLKQNVGRINDEERSQIDAMVKEKAVETPKSAGERRTKSGRKGGAASAGRPASARSASAKKAAATGRQKRTGRKAA